MGLGQYYDHVLSTLSINYDKFSVCLLQSSHIGVKHLYRYELNLFLTVYVEVRNRVSHYAAQQG